MYKYLIEDLISIFNDGAYLSIKLDESIKKLNLSDADKKLYTKILYGVCENKLLLDYKTNYLTKGKRLKPFVRNALRICTYTIDYLNVSNYFIVNEMVEIVKKKDFNASKLLNWICREYIRTKKDEVLLDGVNKVSVELSIPLDLCTLLYEQYHEKLYTFFNNKESFNSYRITKYDKSYIKSVLRRLEDEGYKFNLEDDVIILKDSLLNHDLFKDGSIIAQDYSSARVAHIAGGKPFDDVLDCCAAPGGKSLHMASIMQNKGSILSCDIYEQKLLKINDNANKLGISIIKTMLADASLYDYGKEYDIVIADVPCSGLGVINHKPDIKYHLSIKDIEEINTLQKRIINNVKKYVKVGGSFVYSTCTINKLENEWLIKDFLQQNKNFTKLEEYIFLPNEYQDGFYICKMRKDF